MDDAGATRESREYRLMWGLRMCGRNGRFVMGMLFVGIGVVVLLAQQGIISNEFWRHGWPWIIVVISAAQIVTAGSAGRLSDGVFFGLIGAWLLLVEAHWLGFTYANSWPLTLVAIGASYMVKAVAGTFLPERTSWRVRIGDRERKEGDGHA